MRFEDENFEEEFLKWLETKKQDEIIEDLKKYIDINQQYSYSFSTIENFNDENSINYSEVEIDDEAQIEMGEIYLIKNKNNEQKKVEINRLLELGDAAECQMK